jgi:hypothetical protein
MPTTSYVQKVVASDGTAQDWFGSSVAILDDVAVLGAPDAAIDGRASQGAAYVFTRISGNWTQTQKLVADDGAEFDQFGRSAALFGGKTLVVSAPFARVNGQTWAGAAYVFQLRGGTWIQKQKLTPGDDAAYENFGKSVALNGRYLLVGAGGASINGVHVRGSVYVFDFAPGSAGGAWRRTQRIVAPDPNDETAFFGYPIALSGNTALVGAYASTVGGNLGQGAVYAYKRTGGAWSQTTKLVASDGAARANFGVSVALQGKVAFIGAPGATVHGNVSQGAVYRFEESASGWSQLQQMVIQHGTPISWFGASVNFQNSRVLVGAYATDSYKGAAYVFRPGAGGTWALARTLTASDGQPYDVFGYFTALDDDTALVSAWGADIGTNPSQGAAYFFKLGPLGP